MQLPRRECSPHAAKPVNPLCKTICEGRTHTAPPSSQAATATARPRLLRRLRILVDRGLGELGQPLVGSLFLIQVLLQERNGVGQLQPVRPSNEGAVASDLIVFHRLGGGQQASIKGGHALELVYDLLAFLNDPFDPGALFAFWLLVDRLKHLLRCGGPCIQGLRRRARRIKCSPAPRAPRRSSSIVR